MLPSWKKTWTSRKRRPMIREFENRRRISFGLALVPMSKSFGLRPASSRVAHAAAEQMGQVAGVVQAIEDLEGVGVDVLAGDLDARSEPGCAAPARRFRLQNRSRLDYKGIGPVIDGQAISCNARGLTHQPRDADSIGVTRGSGKSVSGIWRGERREKGGPRRAEGIGPAPAPEGEEIVFTLFSGLGAPVERRDRVLSGFVCIKDAPACSSLCLYVPPVLGFLRFTRTVPGVRPGRNLFGFSDLPAKGRGGRVWTDGPPSSAD